MLAELASVGLPRDGAEERGAPLQTNEGRAHLGQSTQRLQSAGHSTGKPFFPAQGREHKPILWAVRLVGPVGAPELLDGLVCAPGQLMRQVHPLPLVREPPAEAVLTTIIDVPQPRQPSSAPWDFCSNPSLTSSQCLMVECIARFGRRDTAARTDYGPAAPATMDNA